MKTSMRYKLAALAATVACAIGVGAVAADTGPTPKFNRTIYLVNHSSVYSDAQLADELPAYQAGLEDYERYWGGSIKLQIVSAIPYRAWGITISDTPDCSACLGYHYIKSGVPYAKVFTDPEYTTSVTFTHELFEMAADPYVHRADLASATFYLVEVGDPVEDDVFAYTRPSASGKPVAISDFVTDLWYRRGLKGGKFDFANHLTNSLQILAGGYASWWNGYQWMQRFGRGTSRAARPGVMLKAG